MACYLSEEASYSEKEKAKELKLIVKKVEDIRLESR